MIEGSRPYTFDRVIRIALSCVLIWALVQLGQYLSDVLIPFGLAVLIAYLLNPLVCLVQKKIPHRGAAVFVSLSAVSVVSIGFCVICVQLVLSEAARFTKLVQELAAQDQWRERLVAMLPDKFVDEIQATISQDGLAGLMSIDGAWDYMSAYASEIAPWLADLGLGLMGLMGLSVVILYVVFLLVDYTWFKDNWNTVIPPKHREHVEGFLSDFNSAMNRHFRAQAIVAACVGMLFAIGFSIIGLPMAVLFGLFIGLLNMVPYLQLLALIPASLLACMQSLESGDSLTLSLLAVLIVFAVVQVIQDVVLVPRIMGKAFGLRPVIILLAIMIWGKILGLLGLIIALPLTCLAWAWYQRLVIIPQEEAQSTENIK